MIPLNTKRKLGATDVKYKIICAGKEFDIGLNKPVKVEFRGHVYQAKMHSKTKGRIDGLGQLYADFDLSEGHELQLFYMEDTNTILLDEELVMPDEDPEPQDINVSKIQQQVSQDGDDLNMPEEGLWYGDELEMPEENLWDESIDSGLYSPDFNGEFYTYRNDHSLYKTYIRSIARYGDTCYFLYHDDVFTCKYGGNMELQMLLKDPMQTKGKREASDVLHLFVNESGVFVYNSCVDRGPICRLFTHEGKLQGSFEIKRKGKYSDTNCILPYAYIMDATFYCVSGKEFFVYRFNTGEEYCSEFTLPEGKEIAGLSVGNKQAYMKLRSGYNGSEQWYKLQTDPTVSVTNGQISPLFSNTEDVKIPFLHPQHNIVWTEVYKNETWIYKAYRLADGKFAGQKFSIPKEDTIHGAPNIIYFDGKYLLTNPSDKIMSSLNIITGEKRTFPILIPNQFLVMQERLYVLFDYGNCVQYIVSAALDSTLGDEVKLCDRLW